MQKEDEANLKIQRIELENYRQYRGKVSVDLCCDRDRNMNVIQGVNGAGKTNMMNAITWCLYDVEESLTKYAGKKQPIFNDAALRELQKGKTIEARVTLKMISSQGEPIVFERRIKALKDDKGEIVIDENSDFHAFQQKGRDMKESVYDKNFLVNRILPRGVKGFFFFDGERLDEFFKEENSAKVRDAILHVSQLSLVDNAMNHLEKTMSSMRGELKWQGTPQVDQITDDIAKHEKDRDKWREEKKKLDTELAKISDELAKIDEKLKMHSVPLVKELQKERATLQNQLEQLESSLETANTEVCEKVVTSGPMIYAAEAIKYALGEIDQKAKKGEIPPKMKETFVRELLEKGQCICGTSLSRDCPARQKVANLLKEVRISEIYEELTSLKYELNPLLKQTMSFASDQDKLRKRISDTERQFDTTKTQLRDVSAKLEGINIEEVSNLEIARSKLDQSKSMTIVEIRLLEEKIKNVKQTIDRLERDLSKELAKSNKFKFQNEKLKLADETYELFGQVKQKLVDDIRTTIQQKTQDYFLRLIWKKGEFARVGIDENYNVSVINKVGSECLGSLSAGEREVLALSFLAALREVSGFDAPVMIDTPLGKISKEPKENIAELLPEFLKGSQVTMFMTDEEYTPKVREKLSKRIGREYELDYDEDQSQTLVKPYVTK